MITPVILSGGAGTRLWPLSRKAYPKQFLNLVDEENLFTKTASRVANKEGFSDPIVICNAEHRFLVAENLQNLGVKAKSIILEPVGRNTAPAITAVAIDVLRNTKGQSGDIMLVMPSDHLIQNPNKFLEYVKEGEKLAEEGRLVTFGIIPKTPETGYGYIEKDGEIAGHKNSFDVKRFVEKPDAKTAEKFLESGNFYWNSGIFMFKASKYLEALEKYEPEMLKNCEESYENSSVDLDFVRLDEKPFAKCKNTSIDYAVMERADNIAIIPSDITWNDVGNWNSLYSEDKKDENGNAKHGDVFTFNTNDCYIRSDAGMVAAIGVKDLIIVNLKDTLLVANKNNAQDIKKIVEYLEKEGRSEHVIHPKVYRPWGSYEEMDLAEGFKVKRITVKPGGMLSLQSHKHRAEHWVVVNGVANVICGDKEVVLNVDESIYIPKRFKHRMTNKTDKIIEFVEVQVGDYLGEDDIVRYEDIYKR